MTWIIKPGRWGWGLRARAYRATWYCGGGYFIMDNQIWRPPRPANGNGGPILWTMT